KFSNLCGTVYRQGNLVYTSDGNRLISPVGNRVTVFDLVQNVSYTLPFETRRNIRRVALSPNDALLLVVDEDARGMLIHFEKRALLSTFSFGAPVAAKGRPPKPRVISNVRFSPDSKYIAVTFGSTLQLWLTPGHTKEFKPLVKVREFNEHFDTIDALTWSRDSEYVMTGSRDMTARIWRARPSPGFVPRVLGGHKTGVMGVWM
ncbi:tricorn protease domain 2-containing protein, partial [Caulochytrium protostelioides]